MIVAEQKPVSRILEMIEGYENIAIVGCNECVAVCGTGGEREVKVLGAAVRTALADAGRKTRVKELCVERQCEDEFLEEIKEELADVDAVVSIACGVGVNQLAGFLETTPVFPGQDTTFMGGNVEAGQWQELCAGCGECILELTGGICPVARCAKTIMNGPCGGSKDGECELGDRPCAWVLIVERMKKLGTLDKLAEILPPKDWSTSRHGGPRQMSNPNLAPAAEAEGEASEAKSTK
jgi:hypothetical protein